MADDLDYLARDFDLNSLTVPRLRNILVNHDVPYPASAKKAQLIRILEDEVIPQARKLLRERERVRRTSAGITDMSSQDTSVSSDSEHEPEPEPIPPPTPSSVASTRRGISRRSVRPSTEPDENIIRSTRRSTRASTADTDENLVPFTPSAASPRKSAARSVGKHPRASDTDLDEDPFNTPIAGRGVSPRKSTARKLRRSEIIPSTEVHDYTPVKAENSFTYDNPFQSGSPSEIPRSRTSSHDGKRKSLRFSIERRSRKSTTPLSFKQEDGIEAPTRNSFDFHARLRSTTEEPEEFEGMEDHEELDFEEQDESEMSAGEEFTPEEQLDLETSASFARLPKHTQKQGSKTIIASWSIIVAVLVGFGAWWRQEKIEIGYCGLGKPTWSLAATKVPEWASVLEPGCEPCPPHAFCYPDFEARCEHDFILKAHPLSFAGLVPLPPTCEPDSEKARRVKAVADKAVEELRARRAKWECGQLEDNGNEVSPEISEPDLKKEVAKKRRRGLSDTEFDDLWKGAIGEILDKDEVVSDTNKASAVLILTSTSTARLPFTCAARRYVRLALFAYRLPLSLLVLSIGAILYARARVLARRSDIARIPELVATTLDRLATQAALHARGGAIESYISIGQLRDDVLRSELHGKRREELWRRVSRIVEGNANVRAAVREGRSGDVARSWEWIGGIGSAVQIRPGENEKGDQLTRHLLSSPLSHDHNEYHSPAEEKSSASPRGWDESRPIY